MNFSQYSQMKNVLHFHDLIETGTNETSTPNIAQKNMFSYGSSTLRLLISFPKQLYGDLF